MSNDIKVTGTPQTYGDGATRNTKEGKGRFDLIPHEVFEPLFTRATELKDWIDCSPASIIADIADEHIIEAIIKLTFYGYSSDEHPCIPYAFPADGWYNCCWDMLKDLAVHFQKGAEIYGERNCQKGIPAWSFKDSAMRHTTQYLNEEDDEPHLISAIWNLWMLQWTILTRDRKYMCNTNTLDKDMLNRINDIANENKVAIVTAVQKKKEPIKFSEWFTDEKRAITLRECYSFGELLDELIWRVDTYDYFGKYFKDCVPKMSELTSKFFANFEENKKDDK